MRRPGPGGVILLALALAGLGPGAADPPSEVARALAALGPPGLLWGRLAVEEESPDGPWTPLAGVEVRLYPYADSVATELEQIRRQARDSARGYDTAISRLQARLEAYAAQLDQAARGGTSRGWADGEPVRRRVTDPAGLFVFDTLPSGDWLLVAVRVTEFTAAPGRIEPRRESRSGPDSTFLPRPRTALKNAEVWLTRVRVEAGERARLFLTDRGRFMAGPVREAPAR